MSSTLSLVTATKNCRKTIESCLHSIYYQESVSYESIIVDGESTDGTSEIISRYRNLSSTIISELDSGIYDAMNKGWALAQGDVIGYLHGDDMLASPHVLQLVAEAFDDPSVDVVYGDLVYVDAVATNRVIRYWRAGRFSKKSLVRGWMPPHPTLYVRKHWYDRLGGFDTNYRIAGDYDFILRLFSQPALKVVYIPEVFVKMRVGGASNRSVGQVIKKSREDYQALRRSGVGGIITLACKNLRKLHQFWVR